MQKAKTYFDQVPLSVAKDVAIREDAGLSNPRVVLCVICGAPIELEQCKIDEKGEAVHDKCYLAKVKPRASFGT